MYLDAAAEGFEMSLIIGQHRKWWRDKTNGGEVKLMETELPKERMKRLSEPQFQHILDNQG